MKKIFFWLLLTVMAGYSCNKSHDNSTSTWDFTKQKVYVYNYSKKQDTKNKIKIDNPWEQKYMTRSGKFYIQSTNKQLANLLYPNATTFLKLVDEKTQTNDTMSFLSLGFAKYNLSARGSFLDSDSLILFPHFSKKLIKGNTIIRLTGVKGYLFLKMPDNQLSNFYFQSHPSAKANLY